MSRFKFSAVGKGGELFRGAINAPTADVAQSILETQYAHLLTLDEIVSPGWAQLVAGFQDSSEALPVYTRSISVMLDAGLPFGSIFDTAAKGDDHHLNRVMRDVADSVREGLSLSQALSQWKTVFDPSYLGMCRSAEKTGRLHRTFKRLADLMEKRWRLNKRLKAAFSYPILISAVALAIFWLLVAFVVPAIVPSFTEIGAKLPWTTKVLVWLGSLSTSMPVILLVLAAAAFVFSVFYRAMVKGEKFPTLHLLWDQWRLKLPVFGGLLRLAILSRTLSALAAMFESGLPLTEVLGGASQVGGSPVYQRHFERVLMAIKEGDSFAEALESTGAFPPLLTAVAQVGEESGKLPFLLSRTAVLYEDDLDMKLEMLPQLMEPIILGFMGLVVGFIVVGTFQPMINLIQQI